MTDAAKFISGTLCRVHALQWARRQLDANAPGFSKACCGFAHYVDARPGHAPALEIWITTDSSDRCAIRGAKKAKP